ncbi:MAG: MFS transporter [Vicinamibacteria bacterium]
MFTTWRLLRSLPRPVQILIAGTFVNKAGTYIVPYLTIVLMRDFHLSPLEAGLAVAAYGFGSLVSVFTGRQTADRLGRRATMLLSLFGSGVLAICLGFAPNLHAFVVILLGFGFLADLFQPAASAIVTDLVPPGQRKLGFAGLRLAINLGFAAGVVAGGFLVDWDFRFLFWGDGLSTLAYGLVILFFIAETRPLAHLGEVAASPFEDRPFLKLVAASSAFPFLMFAVMTVLPITLTEGASYPSRTYGYIVGLNGLLVAMLEIPIATRLPTGSRLPLAAFGLVISAIGVALNGVPPNLAVYIAAILLITSGEIIMMPQLSATVADWAPRLSRGRYISLFQSSWTFAKATSPLFFLPLRARIGDQAFWPLLGLSVLPASGLLFTLAREDRARRHGPADEAPEASVACRVEA